MTEFLLLLTPSGFFSYNILFCAQFEMKEPQMCKIVCKVTLNDKDVKDLKEKIENEYRVNM